MGALEYVAVARETNLVQRSSDEEIRDLDRTGRPTEGGQAPWSTDLRGPSAWCSGSEGEGLRPLVARTCDVLVAIPMHGRGGAP